MSIIHTRRQASADEIATEMDRRGSVIERLEADLTSKDAEIAKLRDALEPFAKLARIVLSEAPADADYCSLYQDCEGVSHRVTMDECRALVKAGDK